MKKLHTRKKHARKVHNSLYKAGKTLFDGFWGELGKKLADCLIKILVFLLILLLSSALSHAGNVFIKFVPSAQEGDISRPVVVIEIAADSDSE